MALFIIVLLFLLPKKPKDTHKQTVDASHKKSVENRSVFWANRIQACKQNVRAFRVPDPNIVVTIPWHVGGGLGSKYHTFEGSVIFIRSFPTGLWRMLEQHTGRYCSLSGRAICIWNACDMRCMWSDLCSAECRICTPRLHLLRDPCDSFTNDSRIPSTSSTLGLVSPNTAS